ncbi:MAG TPA: aldo/keto reductase [Candidatus Hydrogenedentes bacterium]|nr:aldo/keto reductase [Candidatus Hydrogenedentota bacterium]
MLYTDFGKTGVTVSRLGFGGMRFEKPQQIDEMAAVVVRAFEKGVTYFDTAPGYCEDKSESICGTAFKEMKKTGRPFYVSTKTSEALPDNIRRQCERSLERLNVDAIDFYHVWCLVKPEDLPWRKKQGALDAFRKLKEEGLIRHISVSTHLEHGYVEAMLDQGDGLFESMLIGLNIQNHHLRYDGVQAASRRGMAVVTMNTLGGGILTRHPERYNNIIRPGDASILETALRFNLSLPEITVALVGFRSCDDVDEAVEVVNRFRPFSEADIAACSEELRRLYREFCTQCGYCGGCPQDIPVVRLMEAYNCGLVEGMEKAIQRLHYHWNASDVSALLAPCTQCRACEDACTQHLPILERFEEMKAAYAQMQASGQGMGAEE